MVNVCIYRVDYKKRPQFFALEKTRVVVSLGELLLQLDRAVSALYLFVTPVTSLKTSLRNTGWSRHTRKINLSKSDIFTRAAAFEIPILEKADGKRRSFLEWNNLCLFHWSTENKLTRSGTLIRWRLPYCLNVVFIWAVSSCKTTFLHEDTALFRHTAQKWHNSYYGSTEHSRLHNCWWIGIIFSSPLDYCIWDILQDLVYEGQRLPFANQQDLKDAIKNKWIRRSPLRQFDNPLHNGKTTE